MDSSFKNTKFSRQYTPVCHKIMQFVQCIRYNKYVFIILLLLLSISLCLAKVICCTLLPISSGEMYIVYTLVYY